MSQRKPNRLVNEKSPYLLQHAHNPVDWFAWGNEAFDYALKEDKPILLSIGYSTCHWCHVMEHESFEDDEIASLMNKHFVSIKVDREERPDLDQIYMTAVTAITGQGGWPLTVFLTPEKMPFYGGTYFPPYSRWGHPGFSEVLTAISHSWKTDRSRVIGAGAELTALLRKNFSKSSDGRMPDEVTLDAGFNQLQSQFDPTYGGFGQMPKFPMGHNLSFLLRYWKRTGREAALNIVEKTLTSIANGGMYDQIGGGFHRYSVDQTWHVPHFEKMLYDQALMVRAYLEAYQAVRDPLYKRIVDETLEYVLTQLRDDGGAFYCAEDADSLEPGTDHKKEGAFYVWTMHELAELLGTPSAEICSFHFGVEQGGNVENDPHQEFTAKNILFVARSVEETAKHFDKTPDDTQQIIDHSVAKLFEARELRPRPHLDDKVLVDWNGLMISSLALAASVLNDDQYRKAAREAADFILEKMITPEGRLLHRYRDNDSAILGTLEDYAFFIFGLLDLYEATFDIKYLRHAKTLTDGMLDLFWDDDLGGFFLTGRDAEELIARPKEIYDGALPSGNSTAAYVLQKMYHLTANDVYRQKAEGVFKAFSQSVGQHPSAHAFCLMALDFALGPVREVMLVAASGSLECDAMQQTVFRDFYPNKVLVRLTGEEPASFRELVPSIKGRGIPGRGAAAYVCEGQICRPPVFNVEDLETVFMKFQPMDDRQT